MDIQRKTNDNKGRFYIEQDDKLIAELDFQVKDGVLDAYHTGVRPPFEGQGIAGRLFDEMVKYAREHDYKVLPTCPYILVKFRRNPDDFADIWQK
ncbi:MAG: GNAT family N-acetyltransferase [Proteiniphilum sp.]